MLLPSSASTDETFVEPNGSKTRRDFRVDILQIEFLLGVLDYFFGFLLASFVNLFSIFFGLLQSFLAVLLTHFDSLGRELFAR